MWKVKLNFVAVSGNRNPMEDVDPMGLVDVNDVDVGKVVQLSGRRLRMSDAGNMNLFLTMKC